MTSGVHVHNSKKLQQHYSLFILLILKFFLKFLDWLRPLDQAETDLGLGRGWAGGGYFLTIFTPMFFQQLENKKQKQNSISEVSKFILLMLILRFLNNTSFSFVKIKQLKISIALNYLYLPFPLRNCRKRCVSRNCLQLTKSWHEKLKHGVRAPLA